MNAWAKQKGLILSRCKTKYLEVIPAEDGSAAAAGLSELVTTSQAGDERVLARKRQRDDSHPSVSPAAARSHQRHSADAEVKDIGKQARGVDCSHRQVQQHAASACSGSANPAEVIDICPNRGRDCSFHESSMIHLLPEHNGMAGCFKYGGMHAWKPSSKCQAMLE